MSGSSDTLAGKNMSPSGTIPSSVKLRREESDTVAEAAAVVADEAVESEIPLPSTIDIKDEASILKNLTEGVRDQVDLEKDISAQATIALNEQEDERDKKRVERAESNKEKVLNQKRLAVRRLNGASQNTLQRKRIQSEIDNFDAEVAAYDRDIEDLRQRMQIRHEGEDQENNGQDQDAGNRRQPNESQRDFLIRTGKITPFSRMPARDINHGGDLGDLLMDAEDQLELDEKIDKSAEPQSHQNLRLPGFSEGTSIAAADEFHLRPRKKLRLPDGSAASSAVNSEAESYVHKSSPAASTPDVNGQYNSDVELDDDDASISDIVALKKAKRSGKKTKTPVNLEDLSAMDDGNEENYQARLLSWVDRRSRARHNKSEKDGFHDVELNDEEWFKPAPNSPDHQFENGLKLPGDIYPALFDYQKTGVQWLGELYEQQVGGIIGDEMGLGKTIQIISFLAGLHYSKKLTKPVIVVAPATVLRQWVNEFHRWWPPLRVSILHTSGSGMLNVASEGRVEDEDERYYSHRHKRPAKGLKSAKRIVDRVVQQGHVLVTTYAGLQTYGDILIPVPWGYAVLDEGHKIRNPNTAITVYCKELQTANRIILSGTPMQNNLIELWSLFDFVYPMRLGTLVNFRNQFEVPIKLGGYASATNLQILTATKCAETLKDAISPYLLQRFKVDVAADLPKKSEQVLFCKLTKPQRDAYELFLASDDMTSILNKTRQSLYGIDILRKICNHPDLLDPKLRIKVGYKWGNPNKSGKMQVVRALLQLWKRAGDKILLFSQGVQMLNIIEDFVRDMDGFNFLRMDGSTNIKDRQTMVDQFNNDPEIHVFLLTTKVGGLGVNLTGANRVIIFDPDWNPSTDVQARERAWRLGQKKEVTIYRLMTAGTIEEKIYHRQIFKQFLADKILKDPKERQSFHMKDLYDLFSLGSNDDGTTETGTMFQGTQLHQFTDSNGPTAAEKPSFVKAHAWGTESGGTTLLPSSTGERKDVQRLESNENMNQKVEEAEVLDIAGVSGLEEYRGEGSDDKAGDEDGRIMEGLFARAGVHSVLEHDQIVNGKKKVQADRGMIEREARKVAAEAAAELRRAGELARNTPIGTVTWTGELGEGGRPQNIRRGAGPSSSNILSNLSARQGIIAGVGSGSSSRGSTPSGAEASPARAKDFMRMIPAYIKRQGGSVPSQMLIVHFGNMCQSRQQTEEFKAVLEQVAVLKRGSGTRGRGKWELKEAYKK